MCENQNFRLHAYVKGRVQGVGFRYYALIAAQNYHLKGWVRNLFDGRVEVIAEGEHEDLNQLLRDLRKGPTSSIVDKVDYSFTEAQGGFDRFFVRPTV
jgi:acylphosphatase